MCPICRPGITSRVAYGAVAMARTPSKHAMNGFQEKRANTRNQSSGLPRGLSQVSYSPLLITVSFTSKTTTLLRRATPSQPRRQVRPPTFSLNSSSATSVPAASSQRITLFGGYSGLRPPPRRKSNDDVWQGTTAARVPPVSSERSLHVRGAQPGMGSGRTTFPKQLQGPCLIYCEASWSDCCEYLAIRVKLGVEDLDRT